MISCPNCAHNNPDGAVNCEACFTLLPIVRYIQCPNCESTVLSDAKFCGHCGFNLSAPHPNPVQGESSGEFPLEIAPDFTNVSNLPNPQNLQSPNIQPPFSSEMNNQIPDQSSEPITAGKSANESSPNYVPSYPEVAALFEGQINPVESSLPVSSQPNPSPNPLENSSPNLNATVPIHNQTNVPAANSAPMNVRTQLQQFSASLLHVQTNLTLELPAHLPVIHIGKPNTVIPPDIDVSGFPDSDIVSRIHGDIRAEGGMFYFEDTGSSNGTYINNLPLPTGNRHKLRAGDRISLGKGDKVTFIFQLSS